MVIWRVKIVPEMSYNVLSGTLSLYTTTTHLVYVTVSFNMLDMSYMW